MHKTRLVFWVLAGSAATASAGQQEPPCSVLDAPALAALKLTDVVPELRKPTPERAADGEGDSCVLTHPSGAKVWLTYSVSKSSAGPFQELFDKGMRPFCNLTSGQSIAMTYCRAQLRGRSMSLSLVQKAPGDAVLHQVFAAQAQRLMAARRAAEGL